MKIFIIGNIASGKSNLAKLLAKKHKFTVYSIDKIRIKNNNLATKEGEIESWNNMKHSVITDPNTCIIESTGCSKNYDTLLALCPDSVIIKVMTPVKKCLQHYKKRTKNKKLLPWDFDIEQSLDRNETILQLKPYHIEYNPYNSAEFWEIWDVLIPSK